MKGTLNPNIYIMGVAQNSRARVTQVIVFWVAFTRVPFGDIVFGAFCLDVRTLTVCQLLGFPLNH